MQISPIQQNNTNFKAQMQLSGNVELINNQQKETLKKIIEVFKPDVVSVEELFYFKNQKTIIPVAQARGVILVTLEENLIPMYEYTPLVVKQTITGHGRADKADVKIMVKNYIELDKNIKLDDTIDSVALALCHAQNSKFKEEIR